MLRVQHRHMSRSRRGISVACVGIGGRLGARIVMYGHADLIVIVFTRIRDVELSSKRLRCILLSQEALSLDFNDATNIMATVY